MPDKDPKTKKKFKNQKEAAKDKGGNGNGGGTATKTEEEQPFDNSPIKPGWESEEVERLVRQHRMTYPKAVRRVKEMRKGHPAAGGGK